MADVTDRMRVVIEADGTATFIDGTRLSAEEVRRLGEQLSKASREVGQFSERSQDAGRHVAGLGRDIAQGDWRGAAMNAARLASGLFSVESAATAANGAVGAGVAVLGAYAVAVYAARSETERQAEALLLTGNYVGLVRGQLNEMAREAATGINTSVGGARATMEALVASGRVTVQSLGEMAQAVELTARFTGRSREEVVSDFTAMAAGVADWAAKHNESYHFITFEQYKYIEALEKAGNKQEAMRVTSEALSQHLGGDMTRNLGTLERAWAGVRNWASRAWDAMLNVGREETSQDKISRITAQLEALQNRKTTGRYTEDQRNQLIAGLQAQLETAQESARLERRAALAGSERAREEEAKIAADREKKKDGPKDTTYERLNQQVERRLALARAEEAQGGRLAASEQFRVEMLRQISDAEDKLGPKRAQALRDLVDETAGVMRGNEAQADLIKTRQKAAEMADKQHDAQARELVALIHGNTALEEQIRQVGLTTEQVSRLKVQRIEAAIAQEQINLIMARSNEHGQAEEDLIARRIALLQRQRDLTAELGQAQANDEVRRKNESEAKRFTEDLRRDLTRSLQRAFEAGKDPAAALADTLANTVKTRLTRALAEAMLNPILRPMEDGIRWMTNRILSPADTGWGTGDAYGNQDLGQFLHGGGMVGAEATFTRGVNPAVFRGAPRFHGGGIVDGEVPIIAKRGEGVFTEGQMKALGGGLGGPQINVNVINNNAGAQVNVRQQQGGGAFDIEVLIDSVDDALGERVANGEGALYHSMGGRFGLRTAVT